mgnify:CR=1 FL=1|jgi:hypothetical protein
MSPNKPLSPVKPVGMDLIYYYPCPYCKRKVPLLAPSQPAMGQCDVCRKQFPVVPVDERSLRFIKTMLYNGKAGVDPDYI